MKDIVIEIEHKEGYTPSITEDVIREIISLFRDEYIANLRKVSLCIPTYRGEPYKRIGDKIRIPQDREPISDILFNYTKFAFGHEIGHIIEDTKEGSEFVNKVWSISIKQRVPIDSESVASFFSLVAMNKLGYGIPARFAVEDIGRRRLSIFKRFFEDEIQKFFK